MFVYVVPTGELYRDGKLLGRGYSGKAGPCRNDPSYEMMRACGPIPRGRWRMDIEGKRHPASPAPVIRLWPMGHYAHGRLGFLIHGDNVRSDASEGCIVMPFAVRVRIADAVREGASELLVTDRAPDPLASHANGRAQG